MAPPKGFRHSAETRAKMSASRMGHEVSAETRAKLSAKRKGYRFSDEALQKMRGPRVPNPKYVTVHFRHQRYWIKWGFCAWCRRGAKTDWAWMRQVEDPGGWSDERADYEELCRKCHAGFDRDARRAVAA